MCPHRLFNRDLESNPEQNAAVRWIMSGASKPAPYLVFGPPGTGKTVTLVEAINQVQKCFLVLWLLIRQELHTLPSVPCITIRCTEGRLYSVFVFVFHGHL